MNRIVENNLNLKTETIGNMITRNVGEITEYEIYPGSPVKVFASGMLPGTTPGTNPMVGNVTIGIAVSVDEFMSLNEGVLEEILDNGHSRYEFKNGWVDKRNLDSFFTKELSELFDAEFGDDSIVFAHCDLVERRYDHYLGKGVDFGDSLLVFEVEVSSMLERVSNYTLEDFANVFEPLRKFYQKEILYGNFFVRFIQDLEQNTKRELANKVLTDKFAKVTKMTTGGDFS